MPASGVAHAVGALRRDPQHGAGRPSHVAAALRPSSGHAGDPLVDEAAGARRPRSRRRTPSSVPKSSVDGDVRAGLREQQHARRSAASSGSTTTGSGSRSTHTASAASAPCSGRSASTTATGSPTKRTRSVARSGRAIAWLQHRHRRRQRPDVEVGGGDDRDDARHAQRVGDVDAGDRGVGDRRADEGGVQRAVEQRIAQVGAVRPADGQEARVLDPRTRFPRIDIGAGPYEIDAASADDRDRRRGAHPDGGPQAAERPGVGHRHRAAAAPAGARTPPRRGSTRLYCSRASRSISASVPRASTWSSSSAFVASMPRSSSSAAAMSLALGQEGPRREHADEQHRRPRRSTRRAATSTTDERRWRAAAARSAGRALRIGASARPAAVRGGLAELLLDAQQLVVLGDAVGPGRRAGLDLPAAGGDGEVGDRRVLGLARSGGSSPRCTPTGAPASTASSVSVSVPIWLTFTRIELATPASMPRASRSVFVTKRSSPTSCTRSPSSRVSSAQPSQSSSEQPSSTDTIG